MSRTTFTILVIILTLVALAGGVWFFFIYQPPTGTIKNIGTEILDRLPFGGGFGNNSPETNTSGTGNNDTSINGGETRNTSAGGATSGALKIRMLSQIPVAGFGLSETSSTTGVRYLERASGNVYEIGPEEAKARRITNTTIPRIYEALFTLNGGGVIIRYLRDDNKTIETYSASIPVIAQSPGQTGDQAKELKGIFFPQNIPTISVSPDGKKIFYIVGFGGGSLGFVSDPLNGNRQQIFNSPLAEWLSSWQQEKTITLSTKPSGGIPGYSFSLTPATKAFEKVAHGPGITTRLSPNGNLMLFGDAGETGITLAVYDIKNEKIISLGVRTLPEKCDWATDSSKIYCAVPINIPLIKLPDAWYQGQFFFSDRIWLINPTDGASAMLFDLAQETGKRIDAINLLVSKNESNLFFINKADQSLWSIKL